jgi:hypothetical protein
MRVPTLIRNLAAFPVILTLVACASGGGSSSRPPGATPDRIVRAELAEVEELDAYDAVRQLRPAWLRVRTGTEPPGVYLNNTRFGSDPTALRNLRPSGIERMEYFNATDATTRFGLGNTGGAIVVTQLGR